MNTRARAWLERLTELTGAAHGPGFAGAVKAMNGWIVSLYKVFGFGVLIALVVGMTSYVAVNLFFMLSHSWVLPAILTPQSERVVQANVSFLDQQRQVEHLRSERIGAAAELAHLRRAIRLQEEFEANFMSALKIEKEKKVSKLNRLSKARREFAAVAKNTSNTKEYKDQAHDELEQQYAAGLIGKEDLIKGRYLVGQLTASDITQREKFDDISDEAGSMAKEVEAQKELEQILRGHAAGDSGKIGQRPLTMDALGKAQQYLTAEISRSELEAKAAPLEGHLTALTDALPQQERLLKNLAESPYVRAAAGPVSVAFVPYDNRDGIEVGSAVYGCYLGFIVCRDIGTVKRVLDGEVTWRHPLSSRELRGTLVEIDFKSPKWAEERALIVNHPPFFL